MMRPPRKRCHDRGRPGDRYEQHEVASRSQVDEDSLTS
jgi:hypothetical protein